MDAVGVKAANRHHFLHLNHADLAAGGGGQIEVAGRLAEDKVTAFIGFPRFDDRQVSKNAAFEDIFLTAKIFHFLALGH